MLRRLTHHAAQMLTTNEPVDEKLTEDDETKLHAT
jgi:hypothetical protein